MDNHFVPNLTFGPTMVEALARSTDVPLDAHLMIEDPDRHALGVRRGRLRLGDLPRRGRRGAGPAGPRDPGARARAPAWRCKPATPIEPYEELLPELDMLLLMTVEPGFGGQKFLDLCLPKIRRARELIDKHGVETWLQVDGGVSPGDHRALRRGRRRRVRRRLRGLLRRRPRPDGRRAAGRAESASA